MKQAKRPETKSGYTKLTPAQRYEIDRKVAKIGVTAAIQYYKKVSRFIINGTNYEAIEEFVSERINNISHS